MGSRKWLFVISINQVLCYRRELLHVTSQLISETIRSKPGIRKSIKELKTTTGLAPFFTSILIDRISDE